ncbi:MAG: glycogen synthase GlgA [Candidatus Zixiibacteriota bacterium]
MKILVVASEAVPFAKTGGLGDVVGALPRALARVGHHVKVFIPRYKTLSLGYYQTRLLDWNSAVEIDSRKLPLSIECVRERKSPLEHYFVRNDSLFSRSQFYVDDRTGADYPDNDDRFIFFTRAVLNTVKHLDWRPDVIHVHDWQAALIPAYLRLMLQDEPFFTGVKTVLTIHNLAFQGTFEADRFKSIGLPESHFYPTGPFEFYGKSNFLKAGIIYADKITTVSRRYAEEIQSSEMGCGLDGVLRQRSDDLIGIVNGVDYSVWSPSRDKKIPYTYYPANLSGKRMNKVELLNRLGLPVRDGTPLIGIISRLSDQKGFDLIAEIAAAIFSMDVQMVVLGSGDAKYHELFESLEKQYPDRVKACLKFDDDLAHWIEAGADMFLMPSRFEPCGLNQMYSLKYGTVPIVREVGGLADTVQNYDASTSEGNGFVFKDYSSGQLLATIKRATETYRRKRVWTKIMKAGMQLDYSWDNVAGKYIELFTKLTSN